MLLVPDVTRVWIKEATPERGLFEGYFTVDQRENIIPTLDDINRVVDSLNTIRPVTLDEVGMIIKAPVSVVVDFVFTSLIPNTTSMQNAVEENLKAFFFEKSQLGEDMKEDIYKTAIFTTVDPSTGETVQDAVITSPVGTIVVGEGELAILGNVTWIL